ncbi:lauroyl acyltransferase [Lysobacter sp. A03]|uniref:lauroyl acyltransferase n=1 Tax=Lysobacter sp. A03 TaxID=1199154 RepID=UPI0005B70B98|nr:lauroyl acyltransferase [Lysobacter sp. A03]KIQ97258.1 Lipid A biosynthesis lauroyl acyltransferase [Lysobacter sp. A03]
MSRLLAHVLYVLAALVARLPWRGLYGMADVLAKVVLRPSSRESRVTACNLAIAYPHMHPAQREELRQEVLRTTARQLMETLRLWTRPHAENMALIREQHGTELLDAAIATGRGVIIAAPHYGNWELLNQWLALRTPLAILYAPPDSKVGEEFLKRVRADDPVDAGQPPRVTQVRAEAAGVRQLFKRLATGGVLGILPDQQPKQGDGAFGEFFGTQALTMSLLGRLAARSGATVLMAYCERIDSHPSGPGFAVHIEAAPNGVADPDPTIAVTALNAAVERIARRDPSQYQWTYKRYSLRPPGSGEDNPYWPQCY